MLGMTEDPLIAYNLRNLALIFSWVVFISIVTLIGFLSSKLENAMFFTVIGTASIVFVYLATNFL